MMGSSCSTRRRHRYQSDHHTTDGNHQHRRRSDGNSRHRGTGRLRTRSFSSAVGRLCGASHVSPCILIIFVARLSCLLATERAERAIVSCTVQHMR